MSTKIPPNSVEDLEDGTVWRYELPQRGETAFWTDTSTETYSVTFEISDEFGAEDYVGFLRENISGGAEPKLIATFDGRDERLEGIWEIERDAAYPSDCTYLRTEAKSFDVDWIEGRYVNRLVYSSSSDDIHGLGSFFELLREEYGEYLPDRPYGEGLEEIRQVVLEDGDRKTLSQP